MEEIQNLTQNDEMADALIRAGWLKALTLANRNMALQNLIVYEVLIRRKEAMDQFCKGLKTLGVHSAVQICSELMKAYFIAQPSQLTAFKLIELFANINTFQECEKSERARVFLVECIHSLEQGKVFTTNLHSTNNCPVNTSAVENQ
jgi:hypothetical protein